MSGFRTSAGSQADHAIYARRARESAQADLCSHINNDYKLRHKAQWEEKTDGMIVKSTIRRRANEMKHVHEEQVEIRRQRLKALLESEEAAYQLEFMSIQEKPEDIRNKMAERLWELKENRENARQEMVKTKYDQRWKEV